MPTTAPERAISGITEVAAAVIQKPGGQFLLAQRPEGKPYPGYWEFPGGKIEPGESVFAALVRELEEELGIQVENAHPWVTRVYAYTHATVRLHFYRVTAWRGEPHGRENQALAWQPCDALTVSPMLPANAPILGALALPDVYAISNAAQCGAEVFLQKLEAALAQGLRLVQLREKALPREALRALALQAAALCRDYGAQIMVNGDIELAREAGAHGVHVTSAQLMRLRARPDAALCGASCHDAGELQRAAELGLDYVLLGPVLPTLSHPGLAAMGWEKFAALVRDYSLPVYALGGLRRGDLEQAQAHGAHGIAMLRGAWE